jgi:integrase
VSAWETYLRATGAPETTVRLRTYHLRRLAADVTDPPHRLGFEALARWLAAHDWSPNTRRAYRSSLRSFYTWARTTGRVQKSPAHLLPPVAVPRGRPRPAPEAAYAEALASADERARLAIMLAARCGLRRGEVARLERADVEPDLIGHALRVRGKGGHVRMVPLPADLAAAILARPDGWLFPSTHGEHLTPHHLGKLVSRCLPGELTMHTLRHRCATVAYAGTGDLRAVQELLGHAKPETTARYTAVADEAIRRAMEAAA